MSNVDTAIGRFVSETLSQAIACPKAVDMKSTVSTPNELNFSVIRVKNDFFAKIKLESIMNVVDFMPTGDIVVWL